MRGQCKKLVLALDRAAQLHDEALIFVRVRCNNEPLAGSSAAALIALNWVTPFELAHVIGLRNEAALQRIFDLSLDLGRTHPRREFDEVADAEHASDMPSRTFRPR